MTKVLGRYDATAVERLLDEGGVTASVVQRGFADLHVEVGSPDGALTHIHLWGWKEGRRHLLMDACLAETRIERCYFAERAFDFPDGADLAVVYWLREQDPTREFNADQPRLPLQRHPGLGVLRAAFRVGVRMAEEIGKDGIANYPKYFHDAVIYYRSRLFMFLDGAEQGRFEALLRDLRGLSLLDASLAVMGGAVHGGDGRALRWSPGLQVFPIAPLLTDYFNASPYAGRVSTAASSSSYTWDADVLAATARMYHQSLRDETPPAPVV